MIRRFVLILIALFGGMAVLPAQTNVFVSAAAANDNGDGLTWETAKKTIAAGLTVVGTNGTVFVKAGTYNITAELEIPSGVSMMGGFGLNATGTDTTQRELPGINSRWANASICTIINGSGTHRIATVGGLLEGCVLRLGFTEEMGGGVLLDGGTLRYCVVKECDAINDNTLAAEGGGVYVRNNGLLSNCVITECRGDKGPAVSGGNGTLINNTITRNWPAQCGKAVDYDGNVYGTVVLGQQCWTRQNMRSRHYNNGTEISMGTENSASVPYYYANYNAFTPAQLNQYGYLYNWKATMNGAPASDANPSGVTGICPTGWHVPSAAEFEEMREFVNTILSYRCSGYDMQIAKSLAAQTGWSSGSTCQAGYNQNTNNRTLFEAYPGGQYDNGYTGTNNDALFWTTSQINSNIRAYYLNYSNTYLNYNSYDKSRGFSVRCVKQLGTTTPVVHTAGVSDITPSTATCGGSSSDGGNDITARGVCWSTHHNPTTADSHTTDGTGEGSFTSSLTGFTPGDTIFVRAYATNNGGTYYGEERFFVPGDCGTLVFSDYDGNPYGTVQIGDQCWMRENLRTTHYADGLSIPAYSGSTSNTEPYYNGQNNDNLELYGLYYNWPAAMKQAASSVANPSGVRGVCPEGWHLPSKAEWEQLQQFLNSQSEYLCNNTAGWNAKSLASQTGWNGYYSYACMPGNDSSINNATGFNAYPSGYYYSSDIGDRGYLSAFWCSTQSSQNISYTGTLYYNNREFYFTTYQKFNSVNVRCVKD